MSDTVLAVLVVAAFVAALGWPVLSSFLPVGAARRAAEAAFRPMTEILDAPAHVVAVRITGRTSDADTEAVWAAIDAVVEAHDQPALYAEIGWVWGVSPEQFVADVREGMARLAEQGRIARAAIVSDAYARRSVVRTVASQVEGVAVRVFPPAARSAAMAWAAAGVASTDVAA